MLSGDYLWGMGSGFLVIVIFWILIIIAAMYFVKINLGTTKKGEPESSIDILRKRYASGEIGKDEFDRKKQDILND